MRRSNFDHPGRPSPTRSTDLMFFVRHRSSQSKTACCGRRFYHNSPGSPAPSGRPSRRGHRQPYAARRLCPITSRANRHIEAGPCCHPGSRGLCPDRARADRGAERNACEISAGRSPAPRLRNQQRKQSIGQTPPQTVSDHMRPDLTSASCVCTTAA